MALITKTFATSCPSKLADAINVDGNISPTCLQIIIVGDGNSTFEFDSSLSSGEETHLDSILSSWECPSITDEMIDDEASQPSSTWSSEKIQTEIDGVVHGVVGGIYPLVFHEASSLGNEWLEHGTSGVYSSATHGIIPFKSKLIAVTFSNRYASVDCILRFYSTPEGGGTSPKTLDLEWTLSNKRIARKTNFTSDIIYDAGDKIGIYYKDNGTNADDVVVIMYLKIIEGIEEESGETWSGNYAVSTGGGSS